MVKNDWQQMKCIHIYLFVPFWENISKIILKIRVSIIWCFSPMRILQFSAYHLSRSFNIHSQNLFSKILHWKTNSWSVEKINKKIYIFYFIHTYVGKKVIRILYRGWMRIQILELNYYLIWSLMNISVW